VIYDYVMNNIHRYLPEHCGQVFFLVGDTKMGSDERK
jgi:hypothetical protein